MAVIDGGADAPHVAQGAADEPVAPIARVLALAGAMGIGAVLLTVLRPGGLDAAYSRTWWMLLVVAAGYGLAEHFVFHIEFRHDAITITMSEGATALALAFLDPVTAIAIRVVASIVLIWLTSRPPLYKLCFNATLFAFQTALAFTIVRLVAEPGTGDARFLVAVALALTITCFLDPLVVAAAISCFEGGLVQRVLGSIRTSVVVSPINALVATLTVAPALFRRELVIFAVVPMVAVWYVLRHYGKLVQQHRDLEALHGYSAVVGRSLDLDVIADAAVREAMPLLRVDRGMLQVYQSDGTIIAAASAGPPIEGCPSSGVDAAWEEVLTAGEAAVCGIDADGRVRPSVERGETVLAVPIVDASGAVGMFVFADRGGGVHAFGHDDVSRAATLASQLAPSLRKALLHAGMEHAALHDALTGAPNRLAFERSIRDVTMWGTSRCAAVLMLDLNRFKEVNDTLGHHVGDRVLVEFARRITAQLEPEDVVARFGGDEFAVLVHRRSHDEVESLAERLVRDSYAPVRLDDLDVVVTVSVGIAYFDGARAADVLRHADIAMYAAKRECTEIEVYREEIDRRSPDRLSLLGGLREALENEALEVHYQPKIDLVTSTVIGAEALVRWQHPRRGWISPVDFVRVAEESGLIKQVTDQVLTAAIRTARGWGEAGFGLGVSVNLSPHDLLDEKLPERVRVLLTEHGVPAERLTLEITESALLADTPRTTSTIARLDQLGVRLSLDDFGTGYSSLGYLRRLPVAELKVDQSFVKNVVLDTQDEVIVKSTVDLGHNLGLQVVAEGIENAPTQERLRALGCDVGQGYGISRPLPPKLFGRWLSTTEYRVPRAGIGQCL